MISKCRKCHARETQFAKFPWSLVLFCERLQRKKKNPVFPQKGVGISATQ